MMKILNQLARVFGLSRAEKKPGDLLKGLDQVPWASLRHAYGPATDTPIQIRNLTSGNSQTRADAHERLSTTIYHQGSVYPAATAAIPFLVELLAAEGVPEKPALLDLLARVAAGGGWHESHRHLKLFEKERDTPAFQAKMEEERAWVAELRAAFNQQGEVFASFLNDPEISMRLSASHLLLKLPDLKSQTVPALLAQLEREADQAVRANLLYVLFGLDREGQSAYFAQAWQAERAALPRCVALAQHVLQAKAAAPSEALDQLLECALTADEALIDRYNQLPSPGEFLADMAVPLALASPAHRQQILPWFVDQVEQRRMVTDRCAMGLLAVALLEDGLLADFEALSEIQKRAILAVARMAWPLPTHVFANMVGVLQSFGFPGTPEELGALLDRPIF
jgi:hypothetical protein